MMQATALIPYTPKDAGILTENRMFLGEENIMENGSTNGNGNNYYYEKLTEAKNDIKNEMKQEFDKLNAKIDSSNNIITEIRIKQMSMDKDIEALKAKNSGNEKYVYLILSMVSAAIISGVFKLIFK